MVRSPEWAPGPRSRPKSKTIGPSGGRPTSAVNSPSTSSRSSRMPSVSVHGRLGSRICASPGLNTVAMAGVLTTWVPRRSDSSSPEMQKFTK